MSARDIWIGVAFVVGLVAWFGLTLGMGYLAPGKAPAPGSPEFAAFAQPHVDKCVKRRLAGAPPVAGTPAPDPAALQAECLALFIKTRTK